jgi:DNA processing protein
MEIWLWFSNFCPFFNVRQAERAISELGPYFSINALSLKSIEAYEAAQWFERHEKSWGEFKTKIPSFYENAAKKNYQLTFWNSLNYPELLKRLYHPPAVLFSRGNFDAFKKPSAAVIGARNPTNLGRLWVQAAIP